MAIGTPDKNHLIRTKIIIILTLLSLLMSCNVKYQEEVVTKNSGVNEEQVKEEMNEKDDEKTEEKEEYAVSMLPNTSTLVGLSSQDEEINKKENEKQENTVNQLPNMSIMVGLSNRDGDLFTYLIKKDKDNLCTKRYKNLYVKIANEFVSYRHERILHPFYRPDEYTKADNQRRITAEKTGEKDEWLEEREEALKKVGNGEGYFEDSIPSTDNHWFDFICENEDMTSEYLFDTSYKYRITYVHDNLMSRAVFSTYYREEHFPYVIYQLDAYLANFLLDSFSDISVYKNGYMLGKDGKEIGIYKKENLEFRKYIENTRGSDIVFHKNCRQDYAFFYRFYPDLHSVVPGECYNSISIVARDMPGFSDETSALCIIHKEGKWVSYAVDNSAYIYVGNALIPSAFMYPAIYRLPDSVTEEYTGYIDLSVCDFDEIRNVYGNIEDYFAKGEEEIMGIISGSELQLFLSPYDLEPFQTFEVGEDPQIVMLEWLTEAEYKDWEEYFKTKEEVQ